MGQNSSSLHSASKRPNAENGYASCQYPLIVVVTVPTEVSDTLCIQCIVDNVKTRTHVLKRNTDSEWPNLSYTDLLTFAETVQGGMKIPGQRQKLYAHRMKALTY